jgi:hypothetical protein
VSQAPEVEYAQAVQAAERGDVAAVQQFAAKYPQDARGTVLLNFAQAVQRMQAESAARAALAQGDYLAAARACRPHLDSPPFPALLAQARTGAVAAARMAAQQGDVATVEAAVREFPADAELQMLLAQARQRQAAAAPVAALPTAAPPMPGGPAHPALVQQLLYAKDDDDREDAAERLAKVGLPADVPALLWSAVHDKEDDVREEASKAVRRIHKRYALPTPPAPVPQGVGTQGHRDLVFILLSARHEDSRERAASQLGKYGLPAHIPTLAWATVFDPEDDVREDACRAVARILKRYGLPAPPRPLAAAAP